MNEQSLHLQLTHFHSKQQVDQHLTYEHTHHRGYAQGQTQTPNEPILTPHYSPAPDTTSSTTTVPAVPTSSSSSKMESSSRARKPPVRFTNTDDQILLDAIRQSKYQRIGANVERGRGIMWTEIARDHFPMLQDPQFLRRRYLRVIHPNLKHGSWTESEDQKLINLVAKHGSNWMRISTEMSLTRNWTDVRSRYLNLHRQGLAPAAPPTEPRRRKESLSLSTSASPRSVRAPPKRRRRPRQHHHKRLSHDSDSDDVDYVDSAMTEKEETETEEEEDETEAEDLRMGTISSQWESEHKTKRFSSISTHASVTGDALTLLELALTQALHDALATGTKPISIDTNPDVICRMTSTP